MRYFIQLCYSTCPRDIMTATSVIGFIHSLFINFARTRTLWNTFANHQRKYPGRPMLGSDHLVHILGVLTNVLRLHVCSIGRWTRAHQRSSPLFLRAPVRLLLDRRPVHTAGRTSSVSPGYVSGHGMSSHSGCIQIYSWPLVLNHPQRLYPRSIILHQTRS